MKCKIDGNFIVFYPQDFIDAYKLGLASRAVPNEIKLRTEVGSKKPPTLESVTVPLDKLMQVLERAVIIN